MVKIRDGGIQGAMVLQVQKPWTRDMGEELGGGNGEGVAQGMAQRDVGGRKHGTVRGVKRHQGSEGF